MSSKPYRPSNPDQMVLFPQAMKDALEEDHIVFRIFEHVSLDGSKVEANASKHKAMSYGRMEHEVARLELEIREFTAKAERMDAEPVFGHAKEARGFRRFSLRGLTKVRGE